MLKENTDALRSLLDQANNLPEAGGEVALQEKSVVPSKSTQNVVSDAGYDGLSKVTVEPIPDEYVVPTGEVQITSNGQHTVSGYVTANVEVPIPTFSTQEKSVEPSESQQEVVPDADKDGLSKVTVGAVSSTYVGSGVVRKSSTDLSATGSTVSVPAGYYADDASKSVATTTQATPTIDISATGLITASATQSTGYVSGGTKTATEQMTVQEAKTVIPSTSKQTAVAAGTYVTGQVDVAAIPVSDITDSIINGASNVQETGESIDSFTVNVSIPEGYHAEQTLTKTFTNILPELQSDATDTMILNGYEAYSDQGARITGSMTNNGSVTQTLNANTTSYTIPKGYHDGTGKVSHATVDVPDPTISVNASGLITASGSWTAGFTTDVSYSNTKQLTTQGAKTVTPSTTEQTAVSAGTYVTGDVKVAAMDTGVLAAPTINTSTGVVTATVSTGGYLAKDTSKTLSLTTQAAKTVTPTKSSQTAVAASRYTTGAVTVAAIPSEYITTTDANAAASDIVDGQTAYVNGSKITGNLVIQKYYTGSTMPASSLGNNGDLYLKV